MMKRTLTIIILIIAVAAVVWHRQTQAQGAAPVLQATTTSGTEPNTLCPPIDQILKDPTEGNWTAKTKDGFWKSYSMSFATELTRFVGAQWVGANLGQLTCVYHSEEAFTMQGQQTIQRTLPVLLVYHSLVFQPSGANWTHTARGVYNCIPRNGRADCPFKTHIQPKTGDIYEEAASLKKNPDQPLQPPSY